LQAQHKEKERADPLSQLVRERVERLAYGSYCPSASLSAHPALASALYEPLSLDALSAERSLLALNQEEPVASFHPHDPVFRMRPDARRTELVRRVLRAHQARLQSVAQQTGEPTHELTHLARVSLSPRLSTELWAELVLMELKGELRTLRLDGEGYIEELRGRLLEPNKDQARQERWTHRQLTFAMARLHRMWLGHEGRLFERYLQGSYHFEFPLFDEPQALYQRACLDAQQRGEGGEALARRCLSAYYQLADRQRRDVPLVVVAQHRRRLLEELNEILKRWRQADQVISALFGQGARAQELRREATLDPTLLELLTQLASQSGEDCDLLDWLGRQEAPDLLRGELMVERALSVVEDSAQGEPRLELAGIGLGDELARLLPSELSLLTGDERDRQGERSGEEDALELLFMQRFTEKRLSLYQPAETTPLQVSREEPVERALTQRGPYILCVDSSFSMRGARERLAKGLALQLTARAYDEGRACYIITFSTDTVSVDLASLPNISALVRFLAERFNGGTDLSPALEEAHQLIRAQEGDYQGADVLIVSDFQLPLLTNKIRDELSENQALGVRYAGVLVGSQHSSNEVFTSCSARYTLSHSGLVELQPSSAG